MEETVQNPAAEETAETAAQVQSETERLKAEHAEKLRQVQIDGEVRYILAKMGARNPALAAKALDLSGVQATEDGVTGVEESVRALMASDPYLFGGHLPPAGGEHSSGGVHGAARRDPNSMSDKEYYAMVMGKK
ncbi:MAG: phage scaffolding protein [Clostridia bacterium]|nr:phage scaffolding protein [Clostridia bacterium]